MLPIIALLGLAVAAIALPDPEPEPDDVETGDEPITATAVSDQDNAHNSFDLLGPEVTQEATLSEASGNTAGTEESTDNTLMGGSENDILIGTADNDTLSGGLGEDILLGGSGNDMIFGDDDAEGDNLVGGDGDDIIHAGQDDHVTGGRGDDVIRLSADAATYISDFNQDDDRIEIFYDKEGPAPVISQEDSDDGIQLFADGELVALLGDTPELDLSKVQLVAA